MKKLLLFCLLIIPLCATGATRPDWLDIKGKPLVDPREYGLKTTGTPVANRAAIVTALGVGSVLIPDGEYSVDNSTSGILVATAGRILRGNSLGAKITFTNNDKPGFVVTADDVTVEGITIAGPGTINTDSATWFPEPNRPALVNIGDGTTQVNNAAVKNCRFVNPYIHAIQLYRTCRAKVTNNVSTSDAAYTIGSLTYLSHICVAASAYVTIEGNHLKGLSQGILGGGEAAISVLPGDGSTGGLLRHLTISENTVCGVLDHAIYVSDEAEKYTISNNVASSTNSTIVFAGSEITIAGNVMQSCEQGLLNGRNCSAVSITGNQGTFIGTSANSAAIYIGGESSDTGFQNITITGNSFTAIGSAGPGIIIFGQSFGTDHNRIINVSITGNVLSGWAGAVTTGGLYNSGILIDQDYPAPSGVGSMASSINITGNVVQLRNDVVNAASGIIVSGGAANGIVANNIITNVGGPSGSTVAAVALHGCSDFLVSDNKVTTQAGNLATTYSVLELLPKAYNVVATESISIATGVRNIYRANSNIGSSILLDSTSRVLDSNTLSFFAATDTAIVPEQRLTDLLVNANVNNISLLPVSTGYPFPQYFDLTISNISATATVTFAGTTIAANKSANFIQTATGTAGDGLANTWENRW